MQQNAQQEYEDIALIIVLALARGKKQILILSSLPIGFQYLGLLIFLTLIRFKWKFAK